MPRSFDADLNAIILQAEKDYRPDDLECLKAIKNAVRADPQLFDWIVQPEAALDQKIAAVRNRLHSRERGKADEAAKQQKRERYRATSPALPAKSVGGRRDRKQAQVIEFYDFLNRLVIDNRRLADWREDELRAHAEGRNKALSTELQRNTNYIAIADLARANGGDGAIIGKAVKNAECNRVWQGEMPAGTARKGKRAA